MPNKTKSTEIIETIDRLIEEDDLSTRSGLKLAFSALRDAISVISGVDDRINDVEKKVNVMWIGYNVAVWGIAILGASMIGLVWSLITGAAKITFGNTP